jgi:hypothetical protein
LKAMKDLTRILKIPKEIKTKLSGT